MKPVLNLTVPHRSEWLKMAGAAEAGSQSTEDDFFRLQPWVWQTCDELYAAPEIGSEGLPSRRMSIEKYGGMSDDGICQIA